MATGDWNITYYADTTSDGVHDHQADCRPIEIGTSSNIGWELDYCDFECIEPSFETLGAGPLVFDWPVADTDVLPSEHWHSSTFRTKDWLGGFVDPDNSFNLEFEHLPPCSSAPSLSPVNHSSGQEVGSTSSSRLSTTTLSDCGWKDCSSSISCPTIEKYRAHLKLHAETARERWKCARADGEMKCTWSGCTTKAKYKTEKLFEKHLVNIHINPLVCTVKNCRYTKPFRAKHDLQRHIDTTHSRTSKYRCPFADCTKGFPRKDKWTKHLFDRHDTELCPYAHCLDDTFVAGAGKSTTEHIAKMHGMFECGLDGCNDGRVSGFSDTALSEHLQVAHNMEWATVLKARACVKSKGDSTLRIDHIS